MATTPEGKVKNAVKKVLKEEGVYYFMPVQTGYGAASLDFLCCLPNGRFLAIETKASDKETITERQLHVANEIRKAGGLVLLVDSLERARTLQTWIQLIKLK